MGRARGLAPAAEGVSIWEENRPYAESSENSVSREAKPLPEGLSLSRKILLRLSRYRGFCAPMQEQKENRNEKNLSPEYGISP